VWDLRQISHLKCAAAFSQFREIPQKRANSKKMMSLKISEKVKADESDFRSRLTRHLGKKRNLIEPIKTLLTMPNIARDRRAERMFQNLFYRRDY
jgi:hypothetical protein